MNYTDLRHHDARFAKAPKGFTAHRGKTPPVRGEVVIELLHRTDEGWAVGPRTRAKFVTDDQWASLAHAKGRWRLAPDVPETVDPNRELFAQLAEAASMSRPAEAPEPPA
jgi:hypothetical protein